jgi:regulatory protein
VRSKVSSQGKRRLSFELSRKGVAKDVAAKAIEEVLADPLVDAQESLDRLTEKRIRALTKYEPAVQKRRLLGFLSRRGYGSTEIQSALARAGFGGRS